MAIWDRLFGKKDEAPAPQGIIRRVVSVPGKAKPAPKKPEPPAPRKDRATAARKKPKAKTAVDQALLQRGLRRQASGDHRGAVDDFTKALQANPDLVQAYASRGVSREHLGDPDGAKADYSKSIQIQVMQEINRQVRENPDLEV